MSILVRDPRDMHLKLYIKGADDEIRKRLDQNNQDAEMLGNVEEFIKEASTKGLRTLLYGVKILDEDEVERFQDELT